MRLCTAGLGGAGVKIIVPTLTLPIAGSTGSLTESGSWTTGSVRAGTGAPIVTVKPGPLCVNS